MRILLDIVKATINAGHNVKILPSFVFIILAHAVDIHVIFLYCSLLDISYQYPYSAVQICYAILPEAIQQYHMSHAY